LKKAHLALVEQCAKRLRLRLRMSSRVKESEKIGRALDDFMNMDVGGPWIKEKGHKNK